MKRSLSIRDILLLTISTLTLLIALLVIREVYVNWQQLKKIQELQHAIVISDKLFDATEKLALERDITYTILHTADAPTIQELKPRLKESEQDADGALRAAMDVLNQYDFVELTNLRKNIETQLLSLQELRKQIAEEVLLPKERRQHVLSDRWFGESTALIVQIQELWVEFAGHFADINPIVTQHLRYKHLLRIIADYTGRERAIIGRLIVENANPTPQEFAQLLRGQGVIELSWKLSNTLAKTSGLYGSIAPYYTDARSHYLTLYNMVQDIFYVPGGHQPVSYPIGADLWFELSAQAKESFNALKEASLKEIHGYVDGLEMQIRHTITVHSIFLFLALGLCFYSFHVITRRVIRPIHTMVTALLDATQGKAIAAMPPVTNAEDEIGKLAQVLYRFQENGERYRALVEASSQIIWTWRPGETGELDALKNWWEKTTGQPGSEMLPLGWLEMVHPEDREQARRIWEGASSAGSDFEMEYRLHTRDGGYRHIYVRGVALKKTDGSVREMVGALNDVTARKEAQVELLRYTRALEQSNKELDDFAYIASHDLKEPLRGLFNHATFLLEDYKDKLDEDGVRKLERLAYLSQRMERLVNDLLYFSRLGRQELAIQLTDMNEVIKDIETTMDIFLEERHGRIIVPKPLPTITCDNTRVTEALRNLITNAIKYNDKPEKTVEIGFLESHASPDGSKMDNVFYVKDDGRGIQAEFYEEIFRIFKRLQSSKNSAEEGTGAGLTFVKKIIERHGGKIWLESEMGSGTCFYFTLGMMKD